MVMCWSCEEASICPNRSERRVAFPFIRHLAHLVITLFQRLMGHAW
ncbi:hypothetical protein COLSTE_00327 [Collinsella stercoris DSM 13279]|uniref:Uncharacterized protein n=1 Tax=Collinsella stercoris DSM 13279 TaxID=445975 RepID=B6G8D7_9ACTN|nr:hypothetical protein COLSTE_00327 [Collinsella stercoris DSM 13279]